ncbi:epoxide hydrolase family protein [Chitinophaga sp. ARDCPP14]|uniref:epoxide hydrolase family protein n=1 Tax=Chitinophaga sp. ARDCPP14 TaxID=3391139 RepID=UPI003F51D89A
MTQPFQVAIRQPVLDDLKARILATRWPDAINPAGWEYGMSLSYMKELATYWAHDFDWRKTEDAINAWPNFIIEIDGYKIHYLHVKSKYPDAIPIIISHGWPGSFLEMLKTISYLTDNETLPFDVVVPSLLGFGFSDKPAKEGINASLMAHLWVKLMEGLGYDKFIAQGGDFGAIIATHIAMRHPDKLTGLHMNYIPFNYKPFIPPGEKLTAEETAAQQKNAQFFQAEGAYAQVQTTKPLTLSYGLQDSPVGLCAWILQIFRSFSDPGAVLEQLFSRDELLSNVTLFWITQTIHSSMRLYHEIRKEPLAFGESDFIKVPVGIARYPYPVSFPARKYVERGYHVCYWREMPTGGHFAAMEQPELFAQDVSAFANTILSKQQ